MIIIIKAVLIYITHTRLLYLITQLIVLLMLNMIGYYYVDYLLHCVLSLPHPYPTIKKDLDLVHLVHCCFPIPDIRTITQ